MKSKTSNQSTAGSGQRTTQGGWVREKRPGRISLSKTTGAKTTCEQSTGAQTSMPRTTRWERAPSNREGEGVTKASKPSNYTPKGSVVNGAYRELDKDGKEGPPAGWARKREKKYFGSGAS